MNQPLSPALFKSCKNIELYKTLVIIFGLMHNHFSMGKIYLEFQIEMAGIRNE